MLISADVVLSILNLPSELEKATAGVLGFLAVLWVIGYFVVFWSSTGQTPGDRLLQIRVRDVDDRGPLKPRRALLRYGALLLAAIPLFAGIIAILFNDRRRGFHDRVARTVVVAAPRYTPADRRRMALEEARAAAGATSAANGGGPSAG